MKLIFPAAALLAFLIATFSLNAQDRVPPAARATILNTYATRWNFSSEWINPANGKLNAQSSSYIELANGLNYPDENGDWRPTKPEFVNTPNGFAALTGPQKVVLPMNINQPGSVHYFAEGVNLRSAPLSMGYFDPATGESVHLATIQDSLGELLEPNVVVYPNAFKEILASVRYTYGLGTFHQDIILHEAPPHPREFGLSEFTRLEVWTEFAPETKPPEKIIRTISSQSDPILREAMFEPDFQDEILQLQDGIRIDIGQAFSSFNIAAGQEERFNPHADVPVGKKFQWMEGRPFLIEAVEFRSIEAHLADLPQSALIGKGKNSGTFADATPAQRKIPGRNSSESSIELARGQIPKSGFVIDYVIKNGSATSFTFLGNATYHISSGFGIGSGTATFESGTIIKYSNNAYLYVYGQISCPSTVPPAIFTSKDDNLYGENIIGSTGSPAPAAAQAIWVYYVDFNTLIRNVHIRWAKNGVYYDQNSGVTASHTIQNSKIKNSQTGVYGGFNCPSITISTSKRCNVTTSKTGACISGDLTLDCEGDNDFDELPDAWEITYFGGTTQQNGNGDPDGDGLINFKEYLAGTSPNLPDTNFDGLGDLQAYEVTFNVLVNSRAADYGKEQNTQFESTVAVLNGNVITAFVDSNQGVYALGSEVNYLSSYTPRFVGYSVSQFGGAVFEDKGVPPLSTQGSGTSDDGDAGRSGACGCSFYGGQWNRFPGGDVTP